jgi:uncharacterized protein (DUF2062 family)
MRISWTHKRRASNPHAETLAQLTPEVIRSNDAQTSLQAAFPPASLLERPLFAYWVGCRLLGVPQRAVAFEMSWEWLTTGLLPIWKPFLFGCLVMGTFTAVIGYILLGSVWHLSLVLKYHRRKNAGVARESMNAEK